jgi:hypothetical protein
LRNSARMSKSLLQACQCSFPDGGNMQNLGLIAHKCTVASKNFLTWGKPVVARVWINVAFLFR